jgi:pyruvate dehydrogenase E2 component (dihydrolipoamide acetyltransferase)
MTRLLPSSSGSDAVPSSGSIRSANPKPKLRDDLVPLSKMRSIIARRMVERVQISPIVHNVFKVEMTHIVSSREKLKSRFEKCAGVKLTYMPFIAYAVVDILSKFPILNASLENDSIR